MIQSIMAVIGPILTFLTSQYGDLGTILGYAVLVVAPIVTVLIELMELVVSLTPSTKDDVVVEKLKAGWFQYGLPVLELMPHANIPIAATTLKVIDYTQRGGKAVIAGVKAFRA